MNEREVIDKIRSIIKRGAEGISCRTFCISALLIAVISVSLSVQLYQLNKAVNLQDKAIQQLLAAHTHNS